MFLSGIVTKRWALLVNPTYRVSQLIREVQTVELGLNFRQMISQIQVIRLRILTVIDQLLPQLDRVD